jgi:hypothetical protein
MEVYYPAPPIDLYEALVNIRETLVSSNGIPYCKIHTLKSLLL